MSALTTGLYEGQITYGEIRKHGDFGLGTFNDLDGEMVGFDGTFYQLRSGGSARPVTPEQKTPFAAVIFSVRSGNLLDHLLATAVGEESKISELDKAAGEYMKEEAANKLDRLQ